MESKILITISDYQRLTELMELASLNEKMSEIVTILNDKFKAAKMVPQDKISDNVVTMNSRVLLKEVSQNRQAQVTIAYPKDANRLEGKISVFSPVGLALLGRQPGDKVSWKVPTGGGHFEIIKVIYQPEAVGHYHL